MKVKSTKLFSPVDLHIHIETEQEFKVLTTMFGRDMKIPSLLREIGDLTHQEETLLQKIMINTYYEVIQ